jgi:hypothetical protein
MCWDVDGVTQMGTCVAMCTGSPDEPVCADPSTHCAISGGGALILCIPGCDPIDQPCPDGDVCIPNPDDPESFVCAPDASGPEGQTFDPCEYVNECDAGHLCLPPQLAGECDPMILGCCLAYCDITQPNTCTGQGLECIPWFPEGLAPPTLENVGFCGLP